MPDTVEFTGVTQPNNADKQSLIQKTLVDARIFTSRLKRADFTSLPQSLQTDLVHRLSTWLGIKQNIGETVDFSNLCSLAQDRILEAEKIDEFGDPDIATLQLERSVAKVPPLDYPIIAPYSFEELPVKFSKALELQQRYGNEIKFQLYMDEPKSFYLIEYPDGKKQTLRIINTQRSIDQINEDLARQPSGLPHLEVYAFSDGSIGLLTDWVNGHTPNSKNAEDVMLCSQASDTLITVPWETDNGQTRYDLNYTNFKISTNPVTGKKTAYYVDSDLPEIIIKRGLSVSVPPERQRLLDEGKKKLLE